MTKPEPTPSSSAKEANPGGCVLILRSLFSPAIESLRDLQRASALDKVRKRLGVTCASLGSLSESEA